MSAACRQSDKESDTCDDPPEILFFDDFNGEQDCGWATYNRGGGIAEIENAAMQLTVSQPGQVWWTNPARDFDDVVIRAEARQVSGSNDNAYGLICRYQNEENFYIFLISGDGYYAIGKYQSGSENVQYLTGDGQFQQSDTINTGVASNEMQVSCVGNDLTLEVNGTPLLTVTDPTFVTGDIGLAASTLQAETGVIEFDNVQVTPP
ncbi:MAG: hypothetical protein DCC51_00765 [Anaerolineae bacterium]|nr:MAG: hypothetical protein DCC51_00765 [Anaerolineae bacterium]